MLLSEALELFKSDYIALRGLSSSAEENYELAVLSYTRAIGNHDIKEITPHSILQWRKWMEKRNKTSTVRCHMSKLKNILQLTNKKGLTDFDIAEIYLPKLPPSLPKYLYDYEIEAMQCAADNLRDKLIITLMFTSGLRAGEVSRLTRSDIDGRAIYVRKGKGNTSRVAFISPGTVELLNKYLATRQDNSEIIFRSYRGGMLNTATITHILKKIALQAGIKKPVHAHVLRHSCATHMVRNGIDTSFVQKQLGHAFISTTQVYIHLTNSDLEEATKHVFA